MCFSQRLASLYSPSSATSSGSSKLTTRSMPAAHQPAISSLSQSPARGRGTIANRPTSGVSIQWTLGCICGRSSAGIDLLISVQRFDIRNDTPVLSVVLRRRCRLGETEHAACCPPPLAARSTLAIPNSPRGRRGQRAVVRYYVVKLTTPVGPNAIRTASSLRPEVGGAGSAGMPSSPYAAATRPDFLAKNPPSAAAPKEAAKRSARSAGDSNALPEAAE